MTDPTNETQPTAPPPDAAPQRRSGPAKTRADIARSQAQTVAVQLLGPRAFARGKSKTQPGLRCEIALRSTVPPFRMVVIGRGKTWRDALTAAAEWADAVGFAP